MDLLAVAEEAARAAGAILRERAGRAEQADVQAKSSPTDLVSEADLAAESAIMDVLDRRRPDDAVMGEEGAARDGTSGLRWVVDPLDGTINFLYGHPQWSVSIAVEDAAGTLAGVVYDPTREELFAAEREGAPLLNGEPIAASSQADLAHTLVVTGFSYDSEVRADQAKIASRLLPVVRDIRRMGSAALDLAWTAAGRHDAYFEHALKPWDLAAGALLCRSAGLVVEDLPAAGALPPGLMAAPGAIAAELRALVEVP